MADPKTTNLHNNLFIQTLSQPQEVRSLVEHHFPSDVVELLNLDSLVLQNDSFVDAELRESFCDLLYSVQLRKLAGASQDAYVYLLFEHKSVADRNTAFQLLKYIVRIWEKLLRDGRPLSPIFPFVVYHGDSNWNVPKSIEELINPPEALAPYSVQFRFPLLDLGRLPNEALLGNRFVQNLLYVLKYGRSAELEKYLAGILELLRDPLTRLPDPVRLETILIYIMSTNDSLSSEEITRIASSVFPLGFEPGSAADKLYKEGREEGHEEGRLVGQIQLLQQMLGEYEVPSGELFKLPKDELSSLLKALQQRFNSKRDS